MYYDRRARGLEEAVVEDRMIENGLGAILYRPGAKPITAPSGVEKLRPMAIGGGYGQRDDISKTKIRQPDIPQQPQKKPPLVRAPVPGGVDPGWGVNPWEATAKQPQEDVLKAQLLQFIGGGAGAVQQPQTGQPPAQGEDISSYGAIGPTGTLVPEMGIPETTAPERKYVPSVIYQRPMTTRPSVPQPTVTAPGAFVEIDTYREKPTGGVTGPTAAGRKLSDQEVRDIVQKNLAKGTADALGTAVNAVQTRIVEKSEEIVATGKPDVTGVIQEMQYLKQQLIEAIQSRQAAIQQAKSVPAVSASPEARQVLSQEETKLARLGVPQITAEPPFEFKVVQPDFGPFTLGVQTPEKKPSQASFLDLFAAIGEAAKTAAATVAAPIIGFAKPILATTVAKVEDLAAKVGDPRAYVVTEATKETRKRLATVLPIDHQPIGQTAVRPGISDQWATSAEWRELSNIRRMGDDAVKGCGWLELGASGVGISSPVDKENAARIVDSEEFRRVKALASEVSDRSKDPSATQNAGLALDEALKDLTSRAVQVGVDAGLKKTKLKPANAPITTHEAEIAREQDSVRVLTSQLNAYKAQRAADARRGEEDPDVYDRIVRINKEITSRNSRIRDIKRSAFGKLGVQ